jgi:hypothetical protein
LLAKVVLGLAKDSCWSSSFKDVSPSTFGQSHFTRVKDQNVLMMFHYEEIFERKKFGVKLYQKSRHAHDLDRCWNTEWKNVGESLLKQFFICHSISDSTVLGEVFTNVLNFSVKCQKISVVLQQRLLDHWTI